MGKKKLTGKKPSVSAKKAFSKKSTAKNKSAHPPASRPTSLDLFFECIPDALVFVGQTGKIEKINPRFCQVFAIEKQQALAMNEQGLIDLLKNIFKEPEAFLRNVPAPDDHHFQRVEEMETNHPKIQFAQLQIFSLLDDSGRYVGRRWGLRDISIQLENQRSLAEAFRDIEKRKFEFEKKNQELEKAYRNLEAVKKSVVEANRLKSEFLSNMSHELRTPLNSILALSSILLARMDGDVTEEQEKQIKIIEKSGKNLLRLINDILDLSKIDAGRMDLFFAEYVVSEFANNIKTTLASMLRETNLEFIVDIESGIDLHSTDENKLKQIMLNLLSNAIKFTHVGKITLQVRRTKFDGVLEFAVMDTGIGIQEDDFITIFDPFRQIDGSTTRKYGGTGLGLSVTRKLVELLGGKIWVESELGKGSAFRFILPAKHRGDAKTMMSEKEIADLFTKPAPTPSAPSTDDSVEIQRDPGRKTILMVEDDDESVYIMKKYLGEDHYQIIVAKDGDAASEKALKYLPDVITLDIMLPRKDGWEVLQELKRNPATKHIPVAIVSMIDNKKLGYSLGTSDYLVKPIVKEMFIKRIHKLSEERGLKKILIVDDDLSQAELVEEILESDDFISEVVTSGEMAVQLLRRKYYDLVILDLLMPQIDGFAVLKNLQSDPATEKIPVLFLTGKVLTEEDQKKLSGDNYHIFQKTMFSREKLLAEIHRILKTSVRTVGVT